MSKKDYIKFAKMVQVQNTRIVHTNNTVTDGNADNLLKEQLQTLAESMADIFAEDNPNFDRERFLKACGIS